MHLTAGHTHFLQRESRSILLHKNDILSIVRTGMLSILRYDSIYTSCIMHKKNIGRLTVCIHFSWIGARHKATRVRAAHSTVQWNIEVRETHKCICKYYNHYSKHLSGEHICDSTTISLAAFSLLHDQKHTIMQQNQKDFILTITFHTNSK